MIWAALVLLLLVSTVHFSGTCLQTLPSFSADRPNLTAQIGTQGFAKRLSFSCVGRVVSWTACFGNYPQENQYTLELQVWRDRGDCYEMMEENGLPSLAQDNSSRVDVTGTCVTFEVPPEHQITVQPQDFVGFYVDVASGVTAASGLLLAAESGEAVLVNQPLVKPSIGDLVCAGGEGGSGLSGDQLLVIEGAPFISASIGILNEDNALSGSTTDLEIPTTPESPPSATIASLLTRTVSVHQPVMNNSTEESELIGPVAKYILIALGALIIFVILILSSVAILCLMLRGKRQKEKKKKVVRPSCASDFTCNTTYEWSSQYPEHFNSPIANSTGYSSHWSLTHIDTEIRYYTYPSMESLQPDKQSSPQYHCSDSTYLDSSARGERLNIHNEWKSNVYAAVAEVCREVASHTKSDDNTLGKSVSRKSSLTESLSRTGSKGYRTPQLERSASLRGKYQQEEVMEMYDNPVFLLKKKEMETKERTKKKRETERRNTERRVKQEKLTKEAGKKEEKEQSALSNPIDRDSCASNSPSLSENEAYDSGNASATVTEGPLETGTDSY